jgi:pimeloyl-ACP methyl ester carboxylesterase
LHGGGSYGNWQRHYFPLMDYKDKYRLVIATPNSPVRAWAEVDDAYLQNIVDFVTAQIGKDNIKAFWLVGHSQGGATSNRIVRTDYFKSRVDGFLSLSGGRLGGSPGRADFNKSVRPEGIPAPAIPAGMARSVAGAATTAARPAMPLPDGDFSHIFSTGRREMDEKGLPETSEWAAKYGCGARSAAREIADVNPGYIYDTSQIGAMRPAWGLLPAGGTAQILAYPECKDGRVVADVARLDKGHTEGYEPRITEELIKLMLAAKGGKIQSAQ